MDTLLYRVTGPQGQVFVVLDVHKQCLLLSFPLTALTVGLSYAELLAISGTNSTLVFLCAVAFSILS